MTAAARRRAPTPPSITIDAQLGVGEIEVHREDEHRDHHREHVRRPGRHPVNIGHLVMGIAFLGLVGVWALIQSDVVDGDDIRWLLPVPWVLAGIAGLLATTLSGSRRYAATRPAGSTRATTPTRGRHGDLGEVPIHWLTRTALRTEVSWSRFTG